MDPDPKNNNAGRDLSGKNESGIPDYSELNPIAVTWAHHAILAGKEKRAVYALVATVSALVFTGFQGMEYYQAPFTISDSIYGSSFDQKDFLPPFFSHDTSKNVRFFSHDK